MMAKKATLPFVPLLLIFSWISCWEPCSAGGGKGPAANASYTLASKLYSLVATRSPDEDFVFCPFCLSATMAMLSLGANGTTLKDFRDALGFPNEDEVTLYESTRDSLKSYKNWRGIKMFNGLFLDDTVDVTESYSSALRMYFNGQQPHYLPLGMGKGEAVEMAVEQMLNIDPSGDESSEWEDLRSPTRMSDGGEVTLASYLNFKVGWEKRFDSLSTSVEPFHVSSKEVIMVKMMRQRGHFHVTHIPELKVRAVSLPYLLCAGSGFSGPGNNNNNSNNRTLRSKPKKRKKGCKSGVRDSRLHLIVLMPYEVDGLGHLESHLSVDLLRRIPGKFEYKSYLDLSFPSFRLSSKGDLIKPFSAIVPTGRGDYSRLSNTSLSLTNIFHRVGVTFEERGSRTKSSVLKGPNIQPRLLKVDRPFLGIIHDKKLDLVLVVFRVLRPTAPP